MIHVLFFAQLKEVFGQSSYDLNIETPCSVAQLKQALLAQNPNWAESLSGKTIMCAVNQSMVEDSHIINDGDEVALFPPVTGG